MAYKQETGGSRPFILQVIKQQLLVKFHQERRIPQKSHSILFVGFIVIPSTHRSSTAWMHTSTGCRKKSKLSSTNLHGACSLLIMSKCNTVTFYVAFFPKNNSLFKIHKHQITRLSLRCKYLLINKGKSSFINSWIRHYIMVSF